MYDFAGKVALVTGGSSGIGKATALAFAEAGADVLIASRDAERGAAALAEIQAVNPRARWFQADVEQADQVMALVQHAVDTFGRLDFAFNNASSGGKDGWLVEIEPEDWTHTMNGVLSSVFYSMRYELEVMLAQGSGVIVNNSSVDGLRSFPFGPAYSAAKHGVIGLTKSAAVQYAGQGIRINAICPGWVDTPPIQNWIANQPEMKGHILRQEPIGRMGRPEEIASAVLWLCSPGAGFMAGAAIPVDGGYLA